MKLTVIVNRAARVIWGGVGILTIAVMPLIYLLELLSVPDPFKTGERPVYERAWERMWRIWSQLFWEWEDS